MQHQGSPKSYTSEGINYKWEISSNYSDIPEEKSINNFTTVIKIDPFKFADLMVKKLKDNPNVLGQAVSHAFGDIYDSPEDPSSSITHSLQP